MRKRTFPLSRVYRLLEPGPVVLVTTACKGRANIMTMSWHTMMEFEPPIVGCVISNRNHTFGILKATKVCVINIPTVELAAKAVGCGNTSGLPPSPPPWSRRRSSRSAMRISNARSWIRAW